MTRKRDPETGEAFECTGDTGHCWCFELPPLGLPLEGDCRGPKHLAAILEEKKRQAAKD
jgi:hypothetical protein